MKFYLLTVFVGIGVYCYYVYKTIKKGGMPDIKDMPPYDPPGYYEPEENDPYP